MVEKTRLFDGTGKKSNDQNYVAFNFALILPRRGNGTSTCKNLWPF